MKDRPTGAERLFSRISDAEFADEAEFIIPTEAEKADHIPDDEEYTPESGEWKTE